MKLAGGRGCLAGDDAAAEAAKTRGVATGIKIDAIDQRGMDHRRTHPDMEQQWHADAIQEIAHISGWRAADEEKRQPGNDRRYSGHDLDRAERIAERTGYLPHLRARE